MATRLSLLLVLAFCCAAASASSAVNRTKLPTNKVDNFCQGCRALVSFSRTFNESIHRAEYKDIFKNFCELYYPNSTDYQLGPCPLFVETLFQVLYNTDPVHFCDQIGACGSTLNVQYPEPTKRTSMTPKQSDAICKFCEDAVVSVQSALLNPQFIDQIQQQVSQLCDFFKVIDADKECNQLMDKYLNQAIDFIKTMDPHAYCSSVKFCPSQKRISSRKQQQQQQSMPTLADFNDFGIETSIIINGKEQIPQQSHTTSSPSCLLCKTVVKEMFHFLRENKTEANIMLGLDKICQILFKKDSTDQSQCVSMVNAYTKELIQLLIDETDPGMICVLLEQCLSPKMIHGFDKNEQRAISQASIEKHQSIFDLGHLIHALDPTIELKSAKTCFECKMFIKFLINIIEEPKSVASVKVWLKDNLCESIKENSTRNECLAMIDQYADIFFKVVTGGLNPSAACADLGACSRRLLGQVLNIDMLASATDPDQLPSFIVSPKVQASKAPASSNKKTNVQGPVCDQCLQIVTQIEDYISHNPIDKDVSVLEDKVCKKMPESSMRDGCMFMVEHFGLEIAQALAHMESPRQFCQKIMLC